MAHAQFSDLPAEIRVMIWAETFPGPRVIEPTIRPSHSRHARQCLRLHPTATLATWLVTDLHGRRFDDPPIERCDDPVALHICRESRAQALETYAPMQHTAGGTGFYVDPVKDFVWLRSMVLDMPRLIQLLEMCYQEVWNRFETILVQELNWIEFTTACERDGIIKLFGGLKTIQVMVPPDESDGKQAKRPESRLGQLDAEVARRWGN